MGNYVLYLFIVGLHYSALLDNIAFDIELISTSCLYIGWSCTVC